MLSVQFSSAQELVSRSSTEAEAIGVDDLLPQMMWTGYFLKAQVAEVVDAVFLSGQQELHAVEEWRASSGKHTRHINIRFYFVADRVA